MLDKSKSIEIYKQTVSTVKDQIEFYTKQLKELNDLKYDLCGIPRKGSFAVNNQTGVEVVFHDNGYFYVSHGDWFGVFDGKDIYIEEIDEWHRDVSFTVIPDKVASPNFLSVYFHGEYTEDEDEDEDEDDLPF